MRGTETYGVMQVTLSDVQEVATYCIRTLNISRVCHYCITNVYALCFNFLHHNLKNQSFRFILEYQLHLLIIFSN